ncbi:uncharacterized protein CAALFM_C109940WA [Candida albicans SC5314]|uniref:Uncharacterized protein n=1 Tax=Candida albicans (strain SC5314 / ATCC MYA-2876) TaxID=237561 RepID=A0A1D8PEQ6_CANAL|nr:uncharacterized protein CAALFM_C109940WA [Candida albicans SC5314]AOW26625.1 hypothetical protein CAALFM_C109940WA [Candida albicans SC5314]|eukprot:XP_019330686.1 hypothetical protein CAALFM_C109940WA [Candida albicans SC5314]
MVWTYIKSSLTQKNQYQCLSYLPNGLKLLNIDPAALVNTSLAKLFALPNLSHFVNAIALVIDNEVATIINTKGIKIAILKSLNSQHYPSYWLSI